MASLRNLPPPSAALGVVLILAVVAFTLTRLQGVWPGLFAYAPLAVLVIAVASALLAALKDLGLPKFVGFLLGIAIIETPAWVVLSDANSCATQTGDPSCVAVSALAAYYQPVALLLSYGLFRILRF